MIRIPKVKECAVRDEGARVVLLVEGRAVLDMPWEAADALARALRIKARKAEEIAKAGAVARDAAILLRAGAPWGLTSHPEIQQEAVKLARDDRDLRRYLPGGIRSEAIFGAPSIKVHPRKG